MPITKPKAARKRNPFVRTNVPPVERAISILVICLLTGVGIAIWQKGKHFDPHLYSPRPEALKSTAPAVEGKSGTLRAPAREETAPIPSSVPSTSATAPTGEPGGEESGTPPSPAPKGDPMEIAISGIKPMSPTEFYSPETLYEKIDGRSPAYIGFNFQQLRSRSFGIDGTKTSYVDVCEYRMDTPVNAFGIFSQERDANGRPLDFAPDGYAGEMGFFFRQGACYVQVIASDRKPRTMELAKAVAENRARALPADNSGLDARRRLPNAGLIRESVSFVQDNAQGQAFLKNVFQATYQFEGGKLPFFLMVSEPQAAEAAYKAYLAFCGRFGKVTELPGSGTAKIFQAESFGSVKVIYQREGEIGGVFDARDAEKARLFIQEYLQGKLR